MNPAISENDIDRLVERFYERAREDEEIGPIFGAVVGDWPHHLATLKDFWSTVLRTTGRYKGDPMMRHLPLGLDPQHFARWLALFEETAEEIFLAEQAAFVVGKSQRIAENLQAGIARMRQPSGDAG